MSGHSQETVASSWMLRNSAMKQGAITWCPACFGNCTKTNGCLLSVSTLLFCQKALFHEKRCVSTRAVILKRKTCWITCRALGGGRASSHCSLLVVTWGKAIPLAACCFLGLSLPKKCAPTKKVQVSMPGHSQETAASSFMMCDRRWLGVITWCPACFGHCVQTTGWFFSLFKFLCCKRVLWHEKMIVPTCLATRKRALHWISWWSPSRSWPHACYHTFGKGSNCALLPKKKAWILFLTWNRHNKLMKTDFIFKN